MQPRYIVISSDEHMPPSMNRGAWASRPNIVGDVERSMEEIHTWCEKHSSEGVVRISPGDTLDSFEPEPDRLSWLASYFKKHLEVCQAYYYIQGQHDRVIRCPETPWLSVICDNPKMVYAHKKVVYIAGVPYVFHDNTTPSQLMDFLLKATVELSNATLISHQLWYPWLPANRVVPSLKAIPPQITRVISGDYHVQKDELNLVTDAGYNLEAYSVGPLTIQDVSEPASCRFLVIDTTDNVVRTVPLTCRKVYRFDVQTEEGLDEFVRQIATLPLITDPTSIDMPIVKVRYLTSIEYATSRIREVCDRRVHLFPDPAVKLQGVTFESVYSRGDAQDVQQVIDASGSAPKGSLTRKVLDAVLDVKSVADLATKLDELQTSILT